MIQIIFFPSLNISLAATVLLLAELPLADPILRYTSDDQRGGLRSPVMLLLTSPEGKLVNNWTFLTIELIFQKLLSDIGKVKKQYFTKE